MRKVEKGVREGKEKLKQIYPVNYCFSDFFSSQLFTEILLLSLKEK